MGDKVVCVDDKSPSFGTWGRDAIKKGEIYTIRDSHVDPQGSSAILLFETSTGVFRDDGSEVGYLARRFAPVKETNIEIFREIDRKIFKGEIIDA